MPQFDAAKSGDLSWFSNLRAINKLPDLMRSNQLEYYVHDIAINANNLKLLKWLVSESGQNIDLTIDDNWALQTAAELGHLSLVQWLVEEYPKLQQKRYERGEITAACLASLPNVDITAGDNHAARSAAQNGHVEVLKWIITTYPAKRQQHYEANRITKEQLEAGQNISLNCANLHDTITDTAPFNIADDKNYPEVVKWLINDSWKYGQPIISMTEATQAAEIFNIILDAECADYSALQLLLTLGHSEAEALQEFQNLSSRLRSVSRKL